MAEWLDRIRLGAGKKHSALTEGIANAIERGELLPGTRLPTHRAIADRFSIAVQTVNNSYQELQRRGMVEAIVGRGTFVSERAAAHSSAFLIAPGRDDEVDLSVVQGIYTQSHEIAARQAMTAMGTADNSTWMYPSRPVTGLARHRDAACHWLDSLNIRTSADRVTITNGATHAIFLALAAVGRPGDLVLTERLTENGIIGTASVLGLTLRGVDVDAEGIVPDAFEEACVAGKVTALVWVPTFGNPTNHLALSARRERIAQIALRHHVAVIEDEVYKPLLDCSLPSIAELLPESGFTATSLTKSVMTGLRVGYLAAPHSFGLRIAGILRATTWNTAPIVAEIATRWLEDGTVTQLTEVQRKALRERNAIVREELGGHVTNAHPLSPIAWLSIPDGWTEDALIAVLRERGILVTGSRPFRVGSDSQHAGIRIGLAGPVSVERLRNGLQTIAATFGQLPGLVASKIQI